MNRVMLIGMILLFWAPIIIGTVVLVVFLKNQKAKKYAPPEPEREPKTLGQLLKEHRTACKMTQEFVAESLGVTRQAVSKWESDTSDPSTSNLLALAKLYGVPVQDLLEGIEQ